MTDRELIRQAILDAFKDPDGLALTNAQIIVVNTKDRPPMPYITIGLPSWNSSAGEALDWTVASVEVGGAERPQTTPQGYREATVSLNAYGDLAVEWIERFPQFARHSRTTRDMLRAAGITLNQPVAGLTDLSALLDTDFENRANRTLVVSYERIGDTETHQEFLKIDLDAEFDSPPGPSSIILSEMIDPENPPC